MFPLTATSHAISQDQPLTQSPFPLSCPHSKPHLRLLPLPSPLLLHRRLLSPRMSTTSATSSPVWLNWPNLPMPKEGNVTSTTRTMRLLLPVSNGCCVSPTQRVSELVSLPYHIQPFLVRHASWLGPAFPLLLVLHSFVFDRPRCLSPPSPSLGRTKHLPGPFHFAASPRFPSQFRPTNEVTMAS